MSDRDWLVSVSLFAGCLAGVVAGAAIAWAYAPPVGGEFWPYIRVGAALIGAAIGSKVGVLAAISGWLLVYWVIDS